MSKSWWVKSDNLFLPTRKQKVTLLHMYWVPQDLSPDTHLFTLKLSYMFMLTYILKYSLWQMDCDLLSSVISLWDCRVSSWLHFWAFIVNLDPGLSGGCGLVAFLMAFVVRGFSRGRASCPVSERSGLERQAFHWPSHPQMTDSFLSWSMRKVLQFLPRDPPREILRGHGLAAQPAVSEPQLCLT